MIARRQLFSNKATVIDVVRQCDKAYAIRGEALYRFIIGTSKV